MEKQYTTKKEILELPMEELLVYLNQIIKFEPLPQVETIEDLQKASRILGKLGPLYSWLTNMELMTNIQKKRYKKEDKEKYEEWMIKESVFNSYAKQVNIMYNTISRMVTIKQQINQELRMLGNNI